MRRGHDSQDWKREREREGVKVRGGFPFLRRRKSVMREEEEGGQFLTPKDV